MSTPQPTLDELAEERLDGVLDDSAWQAASALHGSALDHALARATACRAALAPAAMTLPEPVRDRLLMAVAARRARRTTAWWWPTAAAAAAACLTVAWVLTRPAEQPDSASMPMLAKAEESAPEASVTARPAQLPQTTPSGAVSSPMPTPAPVDLDALHAGMARLRQEAESLANEAEAATVVGKDDDGRADASTLDGTEAAARLARKIPAAPVAAAAERVAGAPPSEAKLAVVPRLTLVPPVVEAADKGDAAGKFRSRPAPLADVATAAPWTVHVDPLGSTLVLGLDDLRIEALDANGKVLASATTGWALTITAPMDLQVAAPPAPAGTASVRARIAK